MAVVCGHWLMAGVYVDAAGELYRGDLLSVADWAAWLSRSVHEPEAIAPLLAVPPAEGLQAWPVSRAVSRGSAEGETLAQPLAGAA